MENINNFLGQLVGFVWGIHTVYILVGSGLAFTIYLGFIQFRGFKHALQVVSGKFDKKGEPGEISHFQALCTALSATVGLGNIAGVAIAVSVGGPGATFWMIVCGLVGMATKYSECSLAVMYRKIDDKGTVHGGPMYYIEMGLGKAWKPMAMFFAFATICSSFGASNMFQVNQVASIMKSSFGIEPLITGVVVAILTGIVIIGGIKRIANVTSYLVPIMGLIYFAGCMIVIIKNYSLVPDLLLQIVTDAFTGTAAIGGFTGATFKEVVVQGVRRASFSNEAGLGSAPIAHSAVATKEPVREGIVALLEPFIDTVVICTLTALVILLSGAWLEEGVDGATRTADAFNATLPGFGTWFVPIAVFLFAYSTLISWSYYGERAVDYLFGEKGLLPYRIIFCLFAVVGSVWANEAVLNFSDSMLGLMIAPNLIAVWLLLPRIKKATTEYFDKLNKGEFKPNK